MIDRAWSLAALVISGMVVFFAVATLTGALDKRILDQLKRRPPPPRKADDDIVKVE